MTEYIREIKRQFRDTYGFKPALGSPANEPIFVHGEIPDGEYPMTIEGVVDRVRITNGRIFCCRTKKKRRTAKKSRKK